MCTYTCVCLCLCICASFQVFSRRPVRLHLIDYCSSTLAWFTLCLFWPLSDNRSKRKRDIGQVKTTLIGGRGRRGRWQRRQSARALWLKTTIRSRVISLNNMRMLNRLWWVDMWASQIGTFSFRLFLSCNRIKSNTPREKEKRKNVADVLRGFARTENKNNLSSESVIFALLTWCLSVTSIIEQSVWVRWKKNTSCRRRKSERCILFTLHLSPIFFLLLSFSHLVIEEPRRAHIFL